MTRLLAGRALRLILGVMIIVEAVFLSESFTTLLGTVLDLGGDWLAVLLLLSLKSPQILDFGLPIAILVGVYYALINIREESALVVCAASGISWVRIPVFATSVGTAGLVLSLIVSGYVAPWASYVQRLKFYDLQSEHILGQVLNTNPAKSIQKLGGRTFLSTRNEDETGTSRGHLFVYHPNDGGDWHVSLADDWVVTGPREDGSFVVALRTFSDYVGSSEGYGLDVLSNQTEIGSDQLFDLLPESPRFSTMIIKKASIEFRLDELLGKFDQVRRDHELPLKDLTDRFKIDPSGDVRRFFGEKIARSILCLVAAIFAVLAATQSLHPIGRFVALPLAAVGVLAADVLGRSILGDAAIVGGLNLSLTTIVLSVILLLPAFLIISRVGERIVRPLRDPTG